MTPQSLERARTTFCNAQLMDERHRQECLEALTSEAAILWAAQRGPRLMQVVLRPRLPFFHPRAGVASALRAAGVTEGLTAFARFAANVSDDEAYVVTNVIRGSRGERYSRSTTQRW